MCLIQELASGLQMRNYTLLVLFAYKDFIE